MFLLTILKIPFFWAAVGFIAGVGLGVNDISVWLIAILLLAFLAVVKISGHANEKSEGFLFSGGSALMLAWILGFAVRGIMF